MISLERPLTSKIKCQRVFITTHSIKISTSNSLSLIWALTFFRRIPPHTCFVSQASHLKYLSNLPCFHTLICHHSHTLSKPPYTSSCIIYIHAHTYSHTRPRIHPANLVFPSYLPFTYTYFFASLTLSSQSPSHLQAEDTWPRDTLNRPSPYLALLPNTSASSSLSSSTLSASSFSLHSPPACMPASFLFPFPSPSFLTLPENCPYWLSPSHARGHTARVPTLLYRRKMCWFSTHALPNISENTHLTGFEIIAYRWRVIGCVWGWLVVWVAGSMAKVTGWQTEWLDDGCVAYSLPGWMCSWLCA